MNGRQDKVMSLPEAIKRFVPDGSHISIGGFTINRNPMAAVYEIMRQGIRDLHVYVHSMVRRLMSLWEEGVSVISRSHTGGMAEPHQPVSVFGRPSRRERFYSKTTQTIR